MKKLTQKETEMFIIDWMLSHRFIGNKQTLFENMVRHVPSTDKKIVKDGLENLIKKGLIFTKKKHYGVHISLLPQRLDDIREYIKKLEQEIQKENTG